MSRRLLHRLGIPAIRPADAGYALLTGSVLTSPLFGNLHMRAFMLRRLTAQDVVAVHSVYVVWNMANDVLGGYVSDWYRNRFGSRLGLVRVLSLLWIVASLSPFLDLGLGTKTHYLMSIFLYDGCLSVACIARGSLLLELATDEPSRIAMQRLSSILGNVEALATGLGFFFWGKSTFVPFLIVISLASIVMVEVGYRLIRPNVRSHASDSQGTSMSIVAYISNIRRQGNFWAFVGMSALLEAQRIYHDQFNAVLCDVVTPNFAGVLPALIGATGGIAGFLVLWVAERKGVYWVYRRCISVKVCVPLISFFIWRTGISGDAMMTFVPLMVLTQVSLQAAQPFFGVTMANLADEYALKHEGAEVTSLMWATHAMAAKPLNSAAPVIVTFLLDTELYAGMGRSPPPELRQQAMQLCIAVPFITGILQHMSLRNFNLHGKKLEDQQKQVSYAQQLRSVSD